MHLIGPLQSNKTKDAVALFDAIHTVDRPKIAKAIAEEIAAQGRRLDLFIQVNTGEEPQKAGVMPKDAASFAAACRDDFGLEIAGLMCIPPIDEEPAVHFAFLEKLAREIGVEKLSMGMSGDFETAIAFGATHVRVGSRDIRRTLGWVSFPKQNLPLKTAASGSVLSSPPLIRALFVRKRGLR